MATKSHCRLRRQIWSALVLIKNFSCFGSDISNDHIKYLYEKNGILRLLAANGRFLKNVMKDSRLFGKSCVESTWKIPQATFIKAKFSPPQRIGAYKQLTIRYN